jgi:hypothetical protein
MTRVRLAQADAGRADTCADTEEAGAVLRSAAASSFNGRVNFFLHPRAIYLCRFDVTARNHFLRICATRNEPIRIRFVRKRANAFGTIASASDFRRPWGSGMTSALRP